MEKAKVIKALSGTKTGKPYYDNGLLTINATLPNIVISGDKLKYLSNKADNGILKSFFRILLNNNSKSQSYKDAVIPFGLGLGHERDNIINISNTRAGERDRLGMLGAVKGKDGIYRFKNPNYVPAKDTDLQELKADLGFGNKSDYEFLKWCAENANAFNSAVGKPTEGDAWTRHGIFGDSSIVEAPYRKEDYNFGEIGTRAKNLASDLGLYVYDEIDKHDLMTGDIVDMYYKGSDYLNRAFQEGNNNRTNSHTGSILKTGPDKEHTYVVHSTGNGLKIQPIGELLGSGMFKKSYITGIRRPGTKKHPYLQRGGIIKALKGTKFGNFLNNYGSTIVGGILQLQLLNKLKSAFDSYLKNKYNPNNLVNTDDVILKTNLYLLTLKELNPDVNYGEVDFLNAYLNIYNSELNKAKQQSLKLQELNEFILNNSNLKIDAFSNILESGLGLVGKYLTSSNNSNKSSNNISNYKLDSFWTNPTLNTKRATS